MLENLPLSIETVGFLGSIFVATSFFMPSVVKLRIINMIGGVCFITYGLIRHAYPVALTNSLVAIAHIYYLSQYFNNKEYFKVLHIEKDFAYLSYFLQIHRNQILKYFPDFDPHSLDKLQGFYVLKGDTTVGVFLGYPNEAGDFVVTLDYVSPKYRDLKVAKWLFLSQEEFFRDMGCKRFVCQAKTKKHVDYLCKVGFTLDASSPELYTRDIW